MSSTDHGDREQQEEEVLALQAIYAEAFTSSANGRAEVCIPAPEAVNKITVSIYMPEDYPSATAPVLKLSGGCMVPQDRAEAVQHLHDIFQPGTVVLFEFLAWLQEQEQYRKAEDIPSNPCEPKHPQEHPHNEMQELNPGTHAAQAAQAESDEVWSIIQSGSPFTEKKSVFQAHVAPVRSLEDVERVMASLLTNGKIARATHNIMAYRIAVNDKDTVLQDYDDDGESAAGGRLLKLLALVGAENVVVVVSRWFGGVLLGPARFTHIKNAARQLLDECGYVNARARKAGKRK